MLRVHLTPYRIRRLTALVVLTALTPGLHWGAASAQEAQQTPTATVSQAGMAVSDLEDTFWICDWSATVSRLGSAQVAACASATEELKARKFGGDFDKLIQWWQTNKTPAHDRLNARHVVTLPR